MTEATVNTASKPKGSTAPAQGGDLPGQLKWYYSRLFPIKQIVRWLRYGSDETLSRREISFTLQGDIYLRWKSFPTPQAFLESLKQLAPVKIDFGAIYNFPPADKNSVTAALTPVQKELVFDIDMTDYEDVIGDLGGGTATEVCDRNWRYMATAVSVIDAALREDFGFESIMWVYSGRRGIHCWVGDARARRLTNEQRSAVADYLYVRFEGRENAGRRQNEVTTPMHPALSRAKRVACDETFREFVLGDQGLLNTDQRLRAMTDLIPNRGLGNDVWERAARVQGGKGRWERIERDVIKAGKGDYVVRGTADYIMLRHTYPRLDVNVSREINHLLKAPFCVHPKTGRVCVPFRAAEAESFSPANMAPELGGLLAEMEGGEGEMTERLKTGVEIFEEFVRKTESETREEERAARLDSVDQRNVAELMAD